MRGRERERGGRRVTLINKNMKIRSHRELDVYKMAFEGAMEIFEKRKYSKAFVSKLSDSEGEAAEIQTWFDFALACGYIETNTYKTAFERYDNIIGKLVNMSKSPENWIF